MDFGDLLLKYPRIGVAPRLINVDRLDEAWQSVNRAGIVDRALDTMVSATGCLFALGYTPKLSFGDPPPPTAGYPAKGSMLLEWGMSTDRYAAVLISIEADSPAGLVLVGNVDSVVDHKCLLSNGIYQANKVWLIHAVATAMDLILAYEPG